MPAPRKPESEKHIKRNVSISPDNMEYLRSVAEWTKNCMDTKHRGVSGALNLVLEEARKERWFES